MVVVASNGIQRKDLRIKSRDYSIKNEILKNVWRGFKIKLSITSFFIFFIFYDGVIVEFVVGGVKR